MSTLDRRGFLSGTAAAAALATLEPAAILAQPAPGQIDAKAQFGSLLISAEFEEAPHALNPAIIAEFTSQNAMREVVKSGPERRHVLSGLPPVMMQGTNTSLGYPGSCEADSFGYGLGTYTAARGYPQFDPAGGPANRLSAAWLFSWAQRRQRNTTCGGSLALPYLGLLIVKGAPNEQQVPYEPKCPYIQGVNTDLESYSDVGKFRIGSYKTLPHLLHGRSTHLTLMKQYLNAGHAIAFSGRVARHYDTPKTAMVKGAFAPAGFIPKSGHGQMIVGYDDSLGHTGAFLIQNSFGTAWPYMNATDALMKGRLWWTYEAFFTSQSLGAIAYSIPQHLAPPGAVTLTSTEHGAPVARIIEARRANDNGQSLAVFEMDFAEPVQLNSIRVTPPRATSPIAGPYKAPLKYGFAHVALQGTFPAGRYAVELDAHAVSAELKLHQPFTYKGHVTLA